MCRTVVLTVVLTVSFAAPTRSAPIVLKQLSQTDGGTQFATTPTSLPFGFFINEPNVFPTPVYASWTQNYSPADVGISFFAPADVVAGATAARSSATALAYLEVNGGVFNLSQPWSSGFPLNHKITAIERIVDQLVITPIHETRYTVQFAQRVRIWGEPIPEPGTIILILVGSINCAMGRRTRKVGER
jgi:hypothetical protein